MNNKISLLVAAILVLGWGRSMADTQIISQNVPTVLSTEIHFTGTQAKAVMDSFVLDESFQFSKQDPHTRYTFLADVQNARKVLQLSVQDTHLGVWLNCTSKLIGPTYYCSLVARYTLLVSGSVNNASGHISAKFSNKTFDELSSSVYSKMKVAAVGKVKSKHLDLGKVVLDFSANSSSDDDGVMTADIYIK